jgi:hypothetical protein
MAAQLGGRDPPGGAGQQVGHLHPRVGPGVRHPYGVQAGCDLPDLGHPVPGDRALLVVHDRDRPGPAPVQPGLDQRRHQRLERRQHRRVLVQPGHQLLQPGPRVPREDVAQHRRSRAQPVHRGEEHLHRPDPVATALGPHQQLERCQERAPAIPPVGGRALTVQGQCEGARPGVGVETGPVRIRRLAHQHVDHPGRGEVALVGQVHPGPAGQRSVRAEQPLQRRTLRRPQQPVRLVLARHTAAHQVDGMPRRGQVQPDGGVREHLAAGLEHVGAGETRLVTGDLDLHGCPPG